MLFVVVFLKILQQMLSYRPSMVYWLYISVDYSFLQLQILLLHKMYWMKKRKTNAFTINKATLWE